MLQNYLKPVGQRLLYHSYRSTIALLGPVLGITCFFLSGLYLFNALYVNASPTKKKPDFSEKEIPVASVDITSAGQAKPLLRVSLMWAEQ